MKLRVSIFIKKFVHVTFITSKVLKLQFYQVPLISVKTPKTLRPTTSNTKWERVCYLLNECLIDSWKSMDSRNKPRDLLVSLNPWNLYKQSPFRNESNINTIIASEITHSITDNYLIGIKHGFILHLTLIQK